MIGLYVWKFGYRKLLDPLARWLSWLDPDLVSFMGLIVAGLTALCYVKANNSSLLLVAVCLIFLRMTMNTIDGVMALQRGKKTLEGEVVNALPDRYADVFLLLGLVFCPLVSRNLAIFAMASVFLVSYTGILGKAIGVGWQHHGPLGKVERLILLMVFSLAQYFFKTLTFFGLTLSPLSWCMVVFIVLGQVTVWNRLQGQLQEIHLKEWPLSEEFKRIRGRAAVVYDSQTGNTKTIAEKIATTLAAPCLSINECSGQREYDLAILCTPNIRADCTRTMKDFIKNGSLKAGSYGIVVTYGAPLFGFPTSLTAAGSMAAALKKKPLGRLLVKGYHAKFKTFKGRPDENDLTRAALFAIRIASRA